VTCLQRRSTVLTAVLNNGLRHGCTHRQAQHRYPRSYGASDPTQKVAVKEETSDASLEIDIIRIGHDESTHMTRYCWFCSLKSSSRPMYSPCGSPQQAQINRPSALLPYGSSGQTRSNQERTTKHRKKHGAPHTGIRSVSNKRNPRKRITLARGHERGSL